ncbi:MAG TPA: hypothetical protein VGQ11_02275 [Candidatus Acidoferrales bacterium]|nr:hypothetical protein [Candidatus Acidoferrales bacterium]
MTQPAGLAKAAGMMAVLAALATMLAVNFAPPAAKSARNTRGRELRKQEIPVPAAIPRGGTGAVQEQGAAASRREAGGGRAPNSSERFSGRGPEEGTMDIMTVVNVGLILVTLLFGVAVLTPRAGTVRHAQSRNHRATRRLMAFALCALAAAGTAAAQEPAQAPPPVTMRAEAAASLLTNAEIVQMIKTGFVEETIVKAIQLSETRFDTSAAALLEIKSAGASDKVIQAMLNPKPAKAEAKPATPAKNPLVPDDVGIYYIKNDQLVDIRPELVGWRSGGVGKSLLLGTKGHINGVLKGPQSRNIVATPVELIIRCPETLEIEEYQLLRLDVKPDRREFRALTGGYIHSSSGLDKNAVDFTFAKIAPRVYRIKLGVLPKGEYGFLPPGGSYGAMGGGLSGAMIMQGSASSGKIYSFRVIE